MQPTAQGTGARAPHDTEPPPGAAQPAPDPEHQALPGNRLGGGGPAGRGAGELGLGPERLTRGPSSPQDAPPSLPASAGGLPSALRWERPRKSSRHLSRGPQTKKL